MRETWQRIFVLMPLLPTAGAVGYQYFVGFANCFWRAKIRKLICTSMLIISCATVCLAQAEVSSRVSVRRHPDYLHLTQALRELVSQDAKTERNSFYVSHVNIFKHGYHSAWVYWKEAGVIILLEPDHAAFDPKYDLVWSRRYLHLDKDVVPTLDDLGGSNYLLTREDARAIVAECKRGDKYVILKSTRRW